MKIYSSIEELIGKTPLLRLSAIEKEFGLECTVLAKLESFNPGGSAKDRVAEGPFFTAIPIEHTDFPRIPGRSSDTDNPCLYLRLVSHSIHGAGILFCQSLSDRWFCVFPVQIFVRFL